MKKIFALGEAHHGTHKKEILSVLSESNFDAIFYELPSDFKEFVDSYIETGIFSDRLERYIEGASREGNDVRGNLELLFDYSKDNNVPIICIDSSKTKTNEYNNESQIGKWYLKGESRDEDMFNNVKDYLEDNSGNFLLIAGINHLKDDIHFRSKTGTLGKRLRDYLKDDFELRVL
jgi:hypothetical protein